MNEMIRKWLEENMKLRAEATPEEAQTFWDGLKDDERVRAEKECAREEEDEEDEEEAEDEEENDSEEDDSAPAPAVKPAAAPAGKPAAAAAAAVKPAPAPAPATAPAEDDESALTPRKNSPQPAPSPVKPIESDSIAKEAMSAPAASKPSAEAPAPGPVPAAAGVDSKRSDISDDRRKRMDVMADAAEKRREASSGSKPVDTSPLPAAAAAAASSRVGMAPAADSRVEIRTAAVFHSRTDGEDQVDSLPDATHDAHPVDVDVMIAGGRYSDGSDWESDD